MTEKIKIGKRDVIACNYWKACDYYKQLNRLKKELKWANDEEKYLKDCCIKAGKELEKHSFEWDGKEKNLVVQALQLNQLYEELEQENKELKKKNENYKLYGSSTIVVPVNHTNTEYDLLYGQSMLYKSALEEIREKAQHCIRQDVCALCDYSKECAVPDADGLVYDNNKLLIKLINEVLQ